VPEKPKPFTAPATEVTATGFVSVDKDGKRLTHTVTKDTQVLQGARRAEFSDIKTGDTITGLRKAISDTEFELVRITRFVTPKPAPAPKPTKKPPTP
jgi:hypothetical protein